MSRPLPFLPLLCLVSLGCEDTLSADPFVSDADFLDALPRAEDHTLAVGGEEAGGNSQRGTAPPPDEDDGWPDLLGMSIEVATGLNGITLTCLSLVDAVAETPPGYRSATERKWGPIEVEDDWTLSLDMARTQGDFTWDFKAAQFADGPLPSLCAGAHEPGSGSLSAGRGVFDVWLDNWSDIDDAVGTLATEYDLTEGQELRILIDGVGAEGGRAEDGGYYFWNSPDGWGDFQYRTTLLLDTGEEAVLEVRTRWRADGTGRSDARVLSDELPRAYRFSECFQGGRKVWRWTDLWGGYEEGDSAECSFASPAAVDEI